MNYAMADGHGRIFQTLSGPYSYHQCGEEVSDTTHYVDVSTGEIMPKRPLQTHMRIDDMTVTLEELPAGVTIATNNMTAVSDDEALVITYDVPGTYEISLRGHVEYLDQTLEVTVDDA